MLIDGLDSLPFVCQTSVRIRSPNPSQGKRKMEDLEANRESVRTSCQCGGDCTGRIPRRQFLKVAGLGLLATSLGRPARAMAGPFVAADAAAGHLVPADKQLAAEWVRALFARGTKEVYSGQALENIGMPCGGIGSGQLYLCGDGTLGCWQIMNDAASNWVAGTSSTYQHRGIAKPVEQGFSLRYETADGPVTRSLNRDGFRDIVFKGEYPIGTVTYRDPDCPVRVTLEAFSPFIPLNDDDSALPATFFHITVENTSDTPVGVSLTGWLENPVAKSVGDHASGTRTTSFREGDGWITLVHGARATGKEEAAEGTVVLEDFEGEGYGKWKATGKAMGVGPVKGTLPNQQPVRGFLGEGLVNTFQGGDDTVGTLTSPDFTIEKPFINLLVGGGNFDDTTCVQLLVDGKPVRTATGRNTEALRWESWFVDDLRGKQGAIRIVDAAEGPWGHVLVDHIEFSGQARKGNVPSVLERAHDFGSMALVCGRPGSSVLRDAPGGMAVKETDEYPLDARRVGELSPARLDLAPGASATVPFILAWHFPNQRHGQGHYYAARFADAGAVAAYTREHFDRLVGDTRRWRDTFCDSTLPYWLLDRLHSTVSTLATGTCEWWGNRRFWAFEGVACCDGTCTHVWNYAHAHARLFPSLTRSIRELQDFSAREEGGGFHLDTGLVGFRSDDNYAADGQCGTILKAYREHLMSADDSFLRRMWPRIKKALEYSIAQDNNADGLIENTQHNTYDINYHGANTFVGSLYLAALRAGEEMALEMGDEAFAKHARAVYESGRELTMKRLWNGEYFTQDVDLEKYPEHQYKDGCLSDQLFGQGWAHQVGLGYLYPEKAVKSAVDAVWKYNWAPDVTPYNDKHKPFRWFISPGQAGLFTCTWPKGDYLPNGTVYKNEVWTGIEYQVAGHLVREGRVEEGLALCRAIHDRYQPELYNPYNEIECGDHYARAMASWGVYLALAGFTYHGPKGHLGFAPKINPERFKTVVTTAEGWCVFEQTRAADRQEEALEIRWGKLALTRLSFETPGGRRVRQAELSVNGGRVESAFESSGAGLVISFPERLNLEAGDRLSARIVLS